MKTKHNVIIGTIIVIIALPIIFFITKRNQPMPDDINISQPTDFVAIGILRADPPDSGQAGVRFEYEENGEVVTKQLEMDALTVCSLQYGAMPCVAMSVTFDAVFDGKRAIVDGNEQGENILARKIRVPREGELLLEYAPGSRYVSWAQAIELLRACQVEMATQTHALDVYLDLKSGIQVRAVEPNIDEMFTYVQESQLTCGNFPVATE